MLARILLLVSTIFSQLPLYQTNIPAITGIDQANVEIATNISGRKTKQLFHQLQSKIKDRKKSEILRYAFKNFRKVEGFSLSLNHIATMKNYDGFLYEIETAVDLHKKNHDIISFGQIKQSSSSNCCCEIDIEASKNNQTYWVECKNIVWNNPTKIKKQLCRQHTILDDWNSVHQTEIKHVISSRNSIPAYMKKWLNKQNISTHAISHC